MSEKPIIKELNEIGIEVVKQSIEPFPELYYKEREFLLSHIEIIDNKDYYVVIINENKKMYYDVESGLKTHEVFTEIEGGNTYKTIKYYEKYDDVQGTKIPSVIKQSIGKIAFILEAEIIEVNKNVLDEDFDISKKP